MNENELTCALSALSGQRPKTPTELTENMVKAARRLEAERLRQKADIRKSSEPDTAPTLGKPKTTHCNAPT